MLYYTITILSYCRVFTLIVSSLHHRIIALRSSRFRDFALSSSYYRVSRLKLTYLKYSVKVLSITRQDLIILNFLPNDTILDWSKLKAFADDKLNLAEMTIFLFDKKKTLWEKENKRAMMALYRSNG